MGANTARNMGSVAGFIAPGQQSKISDANGGASGNPPNEDDEPDESEDPTVRGPKKGSDVGRESKEPKDPAERGPRKGPDTRGGAKG